MGRAVDKYRAKVLAHYLDNNENLIQTVKYFKSNGVPKGYVYGIIRNYRNERSSSAENEMQTECAVRPRRSMLRTGGQPLQSTSKSRKDSERKRTGKSERISQSDRQRLRRNECADKLYKMTTT